MKDSQPDLYPPEKERIKQRAEKESLLKQHSRVIWLTGLSGAGKTTIGSALEHELFQLGFVTQILDGDIVRSGINNNLRFTLEDRVENIRRIAEVSKLFLNCGIIIINCFITPTNEMRKMARDIIGENNIIEVYINAPLSVCEERDTKGLYNKARKGEIKNFTGINSPFDEPELSDIELRTDLMTIGESVHKLLDFVLPVIKYKA